MTSTFLSQVGTCALRRWSPVIGDPTVMGWVTVAVYGLAACAAFAVLGGVAFPKESRLRERMFWLLLGLALVALAINKQLDLQSFLTAVGRCVAKVQGWYDARREVQAIVILGLILGLACLALGLWRLMRGTLGRSGPALVGFVFVLGFVAIRAVGFHHVDALINLRLGHLRLNWLFELAGPVLIILGALRLLRQPQPDALRNI